jgi:hypothetical protein
MRAEKSEVDERAFPCGPGCDHRQGKASTGIAA